MAKSKWFRVFLEGDTTDGRKVTRKDVTDCAETFNRDAYGVRVNLEHIRGIVPGGPFDMLGDVLAVEARDDELTIAGKTEKVKGLYCQIEPLPELIAFNKKRQKIYTSVEISGNIRGSGKAGLIGLAVTDSPASFGCEMLQFAAGNQNIFSNRKCDPENMFVQAHEVKLEFDEDATPADQAGAFTAIKDFFTKLSGAAPAPKVEEPKVDLTVTPPGAGIDAATFAAFGTQLTTLLETASKAQADALAKFGQRVDAIDKLMEDSPAGTFTERKPATGPAAGFDYSGAF